jgi:hypothetical protein
MCPRHLFPLLQFVTAVFGAGTGLNARLTPAAFVAFWERIASDPETASAFLGALACKLVCIDEGPPLSGLSVEKALTKILSDKEAGKKKKKKAAEEDPGLALLRERLIQTLSFTSLFFNFNTKHKALVAVVAKWREARAEDPPAPGMADTDGLVLDALEGKGDKRDILSLVLTATETDVSTGLNTVAPTLRGGGEDGEVSSSSSLSSPSVGAWAAAFLPLWIQGGGGKHVVEVLGEVAKILGATGLPTGRRFVLIRTVDQLIHSFPALPPALLDSLIAAAKPLIVYPAPMGPAAHRLLATLEAERRAPGRAFRDRLRLEAIIGRVGTGTNWRRSMHLILNANAAGGPAFEALLRAARIADPAEVQVPFPYLQALSVPFVNADCRGILSFLVLSHLSCHSDV